MTDPHTWNEAVLSRNGSFLQSWEWGSVQEALGRKVFRLSTETFSSSVVLYRLPFGRSYLYAPRGPVARDFHSEGLWGEFLAEVHKVRTGEDPTFLRVEPPLEASDAAAHTLQRFGFRETAPLQPKATRVIDLKKSEKQILAEMEHDTRYSIRAAERRGVRVHAVENAEEKRRVFPEFWRLFEETNARRHLHAYAREYYLRVAELHGECRSTLFLGEAEGNVISAAVAVYFGKTAAYLYAASRAGYGKFNAPTLIVWKLMQDAKQKGCKALDLWGVDPNRAKWKGITAFKESFGGSEIRYAGTWDLVFHRGWYSLYALARRIMR